MSTDEMIFTGIETEILYKEKDIQEDFWEGHYWIFDIDIYNGEVPIYKVFDYWVASEYGYYIGKYMSRILKVVSPYAPYELKTHMSENEKHIKEYIERVWLAILNRIKREIYNILQSKNRIPTLKETKKAIREILGLEY